MGLEVGTQIGDLVPANPPGTDPKSQGDDHLRLLKTCVQGSLGLMSALWTIPEADTGLRQRDETDSFDINLIGVLANGVIEIGDGIRLLQTTSAPFSVGGKVTVGGGLEVLAGFTSVLRGLTTITEGGLTLNQDDVTITGVGNVIVTGGGYATTAPPGAGVFSLKANRSGANAQLMMQTENENAAATYRALATYEHRDNGDIAIGNTGVTDNAFVIVQDSLRMQNLPTSPAGLATGTFWNSGNFVAVAP